VLIAEVGSVDFASELIGGHSSLLKLDCSHSGVYTIVMTKCQDAPEFPISCSFPGSNTAL
jgi:hypothetical protein